MKLRFGTRGSRLALVQTRMMAGLVQAAFPEVQIEEVIIKTLGDKVTDRPLFKVGGQGLFIKEIEEALLENRIDLAVHSLKDMPHQLAEGLVLGSVSPREDPRDALLARDRKKLDELPANSVIGTSSLRRRAQLGKLRPDLRFTDLRGNLDTRLKKLDEGGYDAIILAAAGLNRLGLAARITEFLGVEVMIPAAGQGLLGIECREKDLALLKPVLDHLNDEKGNVAARAERSFLARLQGGCQVPMGVHARQDFQKLLVKGFLAHPSGKDFLCAQFVGDKNAAEELGKLTAEDLLRQGGQKIIEQWRVNIHEEK